VASKDTNLELQAELSSLCRKQNELSAKFEAVYPALSGGMEPAWAWLNLLPLRHVALVKGVVWAADAGLDGPGGSPMHYDPATRLISVEPGNLRKDSFIHEFGHAWLEHMVRGAKRDWVVARYDEMILGNLPMAEVNGDRPYPRRNWAEYFACAYACFYLNRAELEVWDKPMLEFLVAEL